MIRRVQNLELICKLLNFILKRRSIGLFARFRRIRNRGKIRWLKSYQLGVCRKVRRIYGCLSQYITWKLSKYFILKLLENYVNLTRNASFSLIGRGRITHKIIEKNNLRNKCTQSIQNHKKEKLCEKCTYKWVF